MNTVYVLWYEDLPGDRTIKGIFSSEDKAQECKIDLLLEEFEGEPLNSPEDFEIEEITIDETQA